MYGENVKYNWSILKEILLWKWSLLQHDLKDDSLSQRERRTLLKLKEIVRRNRRYSRT